VVTNKGFGKGGGGGGVRLIQGALLRALIVLVVLGVWLVEKWEHNWNGWESSVVAELKIILRGSERRGGR